MNLQQMMKQAQKMQKELAKKQEELAAKTFEASSGGGMVTALVNGKHEVLSLKIDPEVVSTDEVEMLQDLIVAAINEAHRRAGEELQGELQGMMGGMKIPGLM
ncbi:MAG: YbaB/EbfC family nucleoid-associated protein [Deltaproteobacteria bacterium]|nr:YbaB/EbfC family nucleoid-associated protein [Deltaproteobacteria bacterium]